MQRYGMGIMAPNFDILTSLLQQIISEIQQKEGLQIDIENSGGNWSARITYLVAEADSAADGNGAQVWHAYDGEPDNKHKKIYAGTAVCNSFGELLLEHSTDFATWSYNCDRVTLVILSNVQSQRKKKIL